MAALQSQCRYSCPKETKLKKRAEYTEAFRAPRLTAGHHGKSDVVKQQTVPAAASTECLAHLERYGRCEEAASRLETRCRPQEEGARFALKIHESGSLDRLVPELHGACGVLTSRQFGCRGPLVGGGHLYAAIVCCNCCIRRLIKEGHLPQPRRHAKRPPAAAGSWWQRRTSRSRMRSGRAAPVRGGRRDPRWASILVLLLLLVARGILAGAPLLCSIAR